MSSSDPHAQSLSEASTAPVAAPFSDPNAVNRERPAFPCSGWAMLLFILFLFATCLAFFAATAFGFPSGPAILLIFACFLFALILCGGFFTLQPNEAAALVLFGSYRGTVRRSGFFWANPFYGKLRVSLRARNLNGERLKVNDKRGNPIEIAAVVVWRVEDTAQALFDVDNFERYVAVHSESSVRHLASAYAYDESGAEGEPTLRTSADAVAAELIRDLQARLSRAGVVVEEARLTHLAYAPEIAQSMLRRQQAEAVVAAREKIVHGAVSMVEMALRDLSARRVVELDDDRKAAMVSNLLVVLCGETEVHPVVNAGTLYS